MEVTGLDLVTLKTFRLSFESLLKNWTEEAFLRCLNLTVLHTDGLDGWEPSQTYSSFIFSSDKMLGEKKEKDCLFFKHETPEVI